LGCLKKEKTNKKKERKNMKKIMSLLVSVLLVATIFAAIPLTEKEEQTILHMLEEEKLARDVYAALYEKWGANPFNNIGRSEQKHFDAVMEELVIPFGIAYPDTVNQPGVFSDPELQKLYDELVEAGSLSITEAYRVGMTIEDVDIYDLDQALKNTENSELKNVFSNLLSASESHISTFYYQLQKYGLAYTPQYLTQERFEQALQAKTFGNGTNGNQSAGRFQGQIGANQNQESGQGNAWGQQNTVGGRNSNQNTAGKGRNR